MSEHRKVAPTRLTGNTATGITACACGWQTTRYGDDGYALANLALAAHIAAMNEEERSG